MARTLEFDYAKAIEKATRLFWKKGYAGTSVRALLRSMGIGEGSFYNTIKSKRRAYLECLKHYGSTIGRRRGEALFSGPTAASGIRALFKTVLDCLDDPSTPSRLCLMAGSVNRDVLAEPDLRHYVHEQLAMLAERMMARLSAHRDAGLLPTDFEPRIVLPIVITYLQGLWRMALVSYDRGEYERQIDSFLTGLRL